MPPISLDITPKRQDSLVETYTWPDYWGNDPSLMPSLFLRWPGQKITRFIDLYLSVCKSSVLFRGNTR